MSEELLDMGFENCGVAPPACRALRVQLHLYLEGELGDVAEVSRVRDHLSECPVCADYAQRYDRLTQTILESEASDSGPLDPEARSSLFGGRIARALEAVDSLFGRRGGASLPIGSSSGEPATIAAARTGNADLADVWAQTGFARHVRIQERAQGRTSPTPETRARKHLGLDQRWVRLVAAAALVLATGFFASWNRGKQQSGNNLAGAPSATEALRSGNDLGRWRTRAIPEGSDLGKESPAPQERPLRWVVTGGEMRGASRRARSGHLELYGFRPTFAESIDLARDAAAVLEWIVEAGETRSGVRRSSRRFFLVPEAEPEAPSREGPSATLASSGTEPPSEIREIFPIVWFPARLREAELREMFVNVSGRTAKRVRVVVVDPGTLEECLHPPPVDPAIIIPAGFDASDEARSAWGLLLR